MLAEQLHIPDFAGDGDAFRSEPVSGWQVAGDIGRLDEVADGMRLHPPVADGARHGQRFLGVRPARRDFSGVCPGQQHEQLARDRHPVREQSARLGARLVEDGPEVVEHLGMPAAHAEPAQADAQRQDLVATSLGGEMGERRPQVLPLGVEPAQPAALAVPGRRGSAGLRQVQVVASVPVPDAQDLSVARRAQQFLRAVLPDRFQQPVPHRLRRVIGDDQALVDQ